MRVFLYAGVLVYLFSGCSSSVYIPTAHHTPLLENKGDIHAAAYTGTKGTDVHAAYAFTNRIGLGASASVYSENFNDFQSYQDHKYGELALIYSIPAEEDIVRSEVLLGVGIGEGKAFKDYEFGSTSEQVFTKGNYAKMSLQPNIAIGYDAIAFGISPKLSYVSFYDFETTAESQGGKTSLLFFEPAIFTRLGFFKYLILEAQVSGISALREVEFNYDGKQGYNFGSVSFGVTIDLNILGK